MYWAKFAIFLFDKEEVSCIWGFGSFPGLNVLVRICGFQPFLQGLVVVIIQVVNLVLLGVIQLHGPKWSGGEVVVIVLH